MDWDQYFLIIAEAVRSKSECLRKQYGAVIVNSDKIIVSTGFNGTPFGVQDCHECLMDKAEMPAGTGNSLCRAIHAEENAVVFAGREKAKGGTLYLYGSTNKPCKRCRRLIIQVGLSKVVGFDGSTMNEYNPVDWKWREEL